MSLFTPPDLYEANAAWGASCGPGALAALLGARILPLRELFPNSWTTPTAMQAALAARNTRWVKHATFPTAATLGLAFIQLRGPWDRAPVRVQYQHTHWFAFALVDKVRHIYDVNCPPAGGWVLAEFWKSDVITSIMQAHERCSGEWFFRLVLEVHLAEGNEARKLSG